MLLLTFRCCGVWLDHAAVHVHLHVVHVRLGGPQLGEAEALPGEPEGAGAAPGPQASLRQSPPQLATQVPCIRHPRSLETVSNAAPLEL